MSAAPLAQSQSGARSSHAERKAPTAQQTADHLVAAWPERCTKCGGHVFREQDRSLTCFTCGTDWWLTS